MKKSLIVAAALVSFAANAIAQEDPCTAPGLTILEDPSGDWSGTVGNLAGQGAGLPEQDILSLQLAQTPSGDGDLLLHFTLTVGPFTGPLNNAAWFVSFETPDFLKYGVRMETPESGTTPTFYSYLVAPGGLEDDGPSDGRFAEDGTQVPAEDGSGFTADGVITMVVRAQNLGIFPPYAGQTLGPFNAATVQGFTIPGAISGAFTMDEMPAGLPRDGFFDFQEAGNCSADARSGSGRLGGGALTLALLLPFGLAAAARRRRA